MIDWVVITAGHQEGLEFEADFLRLRPDFLVVTEDDKYGEAKRDLCKQVGAQYIILPKTPPRFEPVSTRSIVRWVQAPTEAPLRVDFAGGWLDVPRFSRPGEFIVNCTISPLVSLREWPYEKQAGLGGSGAWALLNGRDGFESEINLGVGCQVPALLVLRDYEIIARSGRLARKYCGGGHGGYALYLFKNAEQREQAIAATPALRAVEPFCKV